MSAALAKLTPSRGRVVGDIQRAIAAAVPQLAVYTLTDSFAELWPRLAAECGFDLVSVAHPRELEGSGATVVLLAGGGA